MYSTGVSHVGYFRLCADIHGALFWSSLTCTRINKCIGFPIAILVFTSNSGRHWVPYQRPKEDVRRMNGCGLQAECFLLDLAHIALTAGDRDVPDWSGLSTLWPGPAKFQKVSGTIQKALPKLQRLVR